MNEIPRVELPSLVVQSEHVARLGGGRAAPGEVVQRDELAYRLELSSRRRAEEVQGAEAIPEVGERPHEEEDASRGRRGRGEAAAGGAASEDDEGHDPPHVDVVA